MEKSKDRRTTAPAPGGSSDDGHLKPRALTEEELAKKKEREGNIAADLDRKRSLFAGASTTKMESWLNWILCLRRGRKVHVTVPSNRRRDRCGRQLERRDTLGEQW